MKRIFAASLLIATSSLTLFAQTESRADLIREIQAKRTELTKLEQTLLAPTPEDRAAYAEFLSQPETGLIRLLPRETGGEALGAKSALTIRGGGCFYSFARLTHEYGRGSDIEFESDHLSVGFAGFDYGAMAAIGDVALEEISSEHPSASSLASYKAPAEESLARTEARSFGGRGRVIDGVLYQSRLPVQLATTYLLRSINYDDSDILVAFRVIRKDSDGSVVLLWKLLNKYPKPVAARSQTAN